MEGIPSDPRIQISIAVGVAVVWLAIAWQEPTVLLLLAGPGAVWRLARRHPRPPREVDDLL